MADTGTAKNVVKLRLTGDPEAVQALGNQVVDMLEGKGYVVIEWSRAYPCPAPDEAMVRQYVTAMVASGDIE